MATTIEFDKLTNMTTAEDGTGYFDVLMHSVNIFIEDQYNKGRITGADYATVYLGAMQSTLTEAVKFSLNKQKLEADIDLVTTQKSELEANGLKDREAKDVQIAKLDVDVDSAERKLAEDGEKWYINKQMLENQKSSSDIDLSVKPRIAEAGAAQKELTLDSLQADIDFNTSKKVVMEQTRKDNIRMKATEQYAEYLKYLGTAGLYPSEYHFANVVGLVNSINKGIEDPSYEYSMIKRDDRRYNEDGTALYWEEDPVTTERDANSLTITATDNFEAYYRADSYKTDDTTTAGKY